MPSMQRKKLNQQVFKMASTTKWQVLQNGKYYKMALTDITINTLSSKLENDT